MKYYLSTLLILITSICYATQVTHNDYVSGGVITASGQNTNENAIITAVNGNLDNGNISASASIAVNKLAPLTSNSVVVTDGSGFLLTPGTITVNGGMTVQGPVTLQSSGTFSNIGFTGNNGIMGHTAGTNANIGNVGEYAEIVGGSFSCPATGVYGDAATFTLGAGDWDLSAMFNSNINPSVMTNMEIGISQTAGNSTTGLVQGSNRMVMTVNTSSPNIFPMYIINYHQNVASSTAFYLKIECTYSSGSPSVSGLRLSARRLN